MAVLQEEASLNEIVQLVGKDSLSAKDQITLETAKMIREDFLQQNSFVDIDSFSEYDRQEKMLAMIRSYDRAGPPLRRAGRWPSCSPSPPGRASAGPSLSPPTGMWRPMPSWSARWRSRSPPWQRRERKRCDSGI